MFSVNFLKVCLSGQVLLGLMACASPANTEATVQPTPLASAIMEEPTLSGFADVSGADFRVAPAVPCAGDVLSLSVSGLNRGSLPIFIYDADTPAEAALTAGVSVGALSVSPVGQGELQITLADQYTTVAGAVWQFRAEQTYHLGAQTLSGQIQKIGSFTLCGSAPTG